MATKLSPKLIALTWPRLPDLTACNYFFYGDIRVKFYATSTQNLNHLRNSIMGKVNSFKSNQKSCEINAIQISILLEKNEGHMEENGA